MSNKLYNAAKVYLEGSDGPIGEVKSFTFTDNNFSADFELFTKKKPEEKLTPERLREILYGQASVGYDPGRGGSLVPQSFVNNSSTIPQFTQAWQGTFEYPYGNAQGSNPGVQSWEDLMGQLQGLPNLMGLRKGEKKVAEAIFQTLTLTFEGVETEVIWFEGEGLADVLERLAQAMR